MQATQKNISGIISESFIYEIPPYQRPYSWESNNVADLLQDIFDAKFDKLDEYFIGSLITIDKKNSTYEIVDGQQRLTTLNIIFAKIRDLVQNADAKSRLNTRILPKTSLLDSVGQPRLVLRKSDQSFFLKHILNAEAFDNSPRKKLDPPQQKIKDNSIAVQSFFEGDNETKTVFDENLLLEFAEFILQKVYIVLVTAESPKSAYRLFNVLNARGLQLSNADLIKNKLFGSLKDETKYNELDEKWLELEKIVGVENLDEFFGHYRTLIKADKAKNSIHEEVEDILIKSEKQVLEILDEIIKVAEIYVEYKNKNHEKLEVRALNRVEFNDWIVPVLAYEIYYKHKSNENHSKLILAIEKITMQNWVLRLRASARNTVYYQLIRNIKESAVFESINEIFSKHAKNQDFIAEIGKDFYGMPYDQAILIRLDEQLKDNSKQAIYDNKLSIEHVMPKSLAYEYWKLRFTEEDHKFWLNKIGNLAMLSVQKNSRAQHKDFNTKKEAYNSNKSTVSFGLTKEVVDKDNWGLDEVEARQLRLIGLVEEVWYI